MTKGERLKYLRQKNNYTLEEIGKKINVARQTYYKYENDIITNIPTDKIELLAKIYNVSESYIMCWDENKKITFTDHEEELIKKYRQLDADDKKEIDILLDAKYIKSISKSKDTQNRVG